MSQWGLGQVPRLEIYKGLIFGCFDENVPSLDEYLGDMKYYIDFYFDRREGGIEILGGVTKAKIPANWKMAAEQFAGDSYHAQFTHVSNFSVIAPPNMERRDYAEQAKIGAERMLAAGRQFTSPFGHGTGFLSEEGQRFRFDRRRPDHRPVRGVDPAGDRSAPGCRPQAHERPALHHFSQLLLAESGADLAGLAPKGTQRPRVLVVRVCRQAGSGRMKEAVVG